MKLSDLFEDDAFPDEAPLVLTLINNLLKKGTEVRVYYRGDGGSMVNLEWDPPAQHGGNGATSFKLEDGRYMTIRDDNLDKLKLIKSRRSSFSGVNMFTLRAPNVDEGRTGMGSEQHRSTVVRETMAWINMVDLEFKDLIKGAGWRLSKAPTAGLDGGYFGGTLQATASSKRALISLHEQREMMMKLIIKKLLHYVKEGHRVSATPYATHAMAKRHLTTKDTVADVLDMVEDQGSFISMDGAKFDMYWHISLPQGIRDRYEAATRKLMGDSDED
jgi:hypothetical protein